MGGRDVAWSIASYTGIKKIRRDTSRRVGVQGELRIWTERRVMHNHMVGMKLFSPHTVEWLRKTPSVTTYRVNSLRFDAAQIRTTLEDYLERRRVEMGLARRPRVSAPAPDAVAVDSWPGADRLRTPDPLAEDAIVDAACGRAVLRGAHVYAPGVLGLSPDAVAGSPVNIYADVRGRCRRGEKRHERDAAATRYVGRGTLRQTRADLFAEGARPKGVAIETTMPASGVPAIDEDALPPGACLLQNLPSIVCCWALDPRRGQLVLDMCAAPGNKTTHLAELMGDEGIVVALDRTEAKVATIRAKCASRSVTSVRAFAFDSTRSVRDGEDVPVTPLPVTDGPPFSPESFDRVLLDAPCSALGQRPALETELEMGERELRSHVPLQRKLFRAAVRLLKSGGRLAYSTCTLLEAECEGIVSWALREFPEISLVEANPKFGGPGSRESTLSDEQRSMVQRFGPKDDDDDSSDSTYVDSIGFFIAVFEKK